MFVCVVNKGHELLTSKQKQHARRNPLFTFCWLDDEWFRKLSLNLY